MARGGAGLDYTEAAIDQGACDRESSQRFHQRTGAVGDPRPFVRLLLDLRHMRVEAHPHRVFEREGLERAHALQGLLQRLENLRAAGKLVVRDRLDAADHLAQDQHCRRHDDDAEERHDGILHSHDRGEADERQQIAANRGNEQVQHLACCGGPGREPGHELGAVAVGKEADVMLQQLGEHPPLIVGDDSIADACQRECLSIGRHRLDHEDHGGYQGEDDDSGEVLVHIGLVDHVANQIGAEGGAGGGNAHQAKRERIATPLAGRLFQEQAPDQAGRTVGIREQALKVRFEHTHPVARQLEPRRPRAPFLPRRQRFSSGIGPIAG